MALPWKLARESSHKPPNHAHRIAIIEDNREFARTIETFFNRPGSGVKCIAVYTTAEDALERLPDARPDVIMVDINLPGMSGIECIARIKLQHPEVISIILTAFEEDALIFEALKAGASGYLLKRSSPEELTSALKEAVSGGAPMSPQIARQVVNFFYHAPAPKSSASLSPREQEVIELLADGLLYKEIAERLNLTFETVRTYVKLIYEKLQAHSRMDAVTKWRSEGAKHPRTR